MRARLTAVVLVLALASPARAEEPVLRPPYDLRTDVAIIAVAGGGALALLALKQQLASLTCRWCNPPSFDAHVTRALGWSDTGAASTTSDVLQLVLGAGVLGNALSTATAAATRSSASSTSSSSARPRASRCSSTPA